MIPLGPSVELQLITFLREQREADIAGTLRRLADMYTAHEAKDAERHLEIVGTLRGHSLRIGELEKDRDKLESKMEITGAHQLTDLKDGRKMVLSAIGAIVLMVISSIITAVLTRR